LGTLQHGKYLPVIENTVCNGIINFSNNGLVGLLKLGKKKQKSTLFITVDGQILSAINFFIPKCIYKLILGERFSFKPHDSLAI
jgi:hypothetical protein